MCSVTIIENIELSPLFHTDKFLAIYYKTSRHLPYTDIEEDFRAV